MTSLDIVNLKFSFDGTRELINCPALHFESGNIYALVGPNGSGKTTFLKILLGLLKPSEGSIQGLKDNIIGFVPDYNGLYDSLTILENIKFRLSLYKKNYQDEKSRVNQMLIRYQLDHDANKLIRDLSLGMRKKVSLICALAVHPTLLILDEPTGGLDHQSQIELTEMLSQFISPSTMVICTSHDRDFIESLPSCRTIDFPLEASIWEL